jgi:hypothetical protein
MITTELKFLVCAIVENKKHLKAIGFKNELIDSLNHIPLNHYVLSFFSDNEEINTLKLENLKLSFKNIQLTNSYKNYESWYDKERDHHLESIKTIGALEYTLYSINEHTKHYSTNNKKQLIKSMQLIKDDLNIHKDRINDTKKLLNDF